tara:strand:- start:1627 stop:1980 length:354 start_codon:yes stop_codon:yes gene_type:complete
MPKVKKKSSPAYVSSKSRQTAEKMLSEKLRSEGYTLGRSDRRAPSFKLYQDTKSGEYRYRKAEKMAKGGRVKAKKDACYHKVKAAEIAAGNTWPSAYASGRLAKCRKMGSGNYGKKK